MATIDYKVGQALWFQPYNSLYKPQFVQVVKVGRKWAYLSFNTYASDWKRVAIGAECVESDGTGSRHIGQLYENHGSYLRAKELHDAWVEFSRATADRRIPAGLTLEKLQQIKEILGWI